MATQTAVREEETDRGSDRNESVPQGHVLDVPTMPAHRMWGADRSRAAGAVPLAVPRAPVLTIDMPENRVMELHRVMIQRPSPGQIQLQVETQQSWRRQP